MKTIITASLVKKLRSRTGAGFLECKRALVEENGNIESSIDNLRKKGKIHAEKKMNKVTNQGAIFTKIQNNYGVMLELNCETDFVAKDDLFLNLGRDIVLTAAKKEIKDIKEIKNTFEEKRINLILKVSENININRFCFIQGTHLFDYVHALRIGVLLDATHFNKTVLKNIAMHIAASNPQFLDSKNVSDIVFQREYKIQLELAKNLNKPNNILNKIIEGKMNKFVNSISLTGQNFIMDPSRKVKDILIENNLNIKSFIRFELGENFS